MTEKEYVDVSNLARLRVIASAMQGLSGIGTLGKPEIGGMQELVDDAISKLESAVERMNMEA